MNSCHFEHPVVFRTIFLTENSHLNVPIIFRQIEALNLLLQEKDQDLIRIKAERDSLEEAKERLK